MRAQALVEHLDVAGAAHRLEREGTLAIVEGEHVLAELLPMAAGFPERAGEQLGGADLAEAGTAHAGADIVLDHAIERVAAGMPEHHARPFLLLVEEIEAVGDGAVVV